MKTMRRIWAVLWLTASAAAWSSPEPREHEAVTLADQARLNAMLAGDTKALDAAMTDDCLYVHSYGKQQTKQEFIAAFKAGELRYRSLRYTEGPTIRVHGGDTALVTGKMEIEVINREGKTLKPTLLVTAVYVRRDAEWRLASYQSTPASPQVR